MRTARAKALLAGLGVAVLAASTTVVADHAWGSYHWARASSSFTIQAGDNVDSRWDDYLDEAIRDWNQSKVLQLTEVTGGTNP